MNNKYLGIFQAVNDKSRWIGVQITDNKVFLRREDSVNDSHYIKLEALKKRVFIFDLGKGRKAVCHLSIQRNVNYYVDLDLQQL
jgi:hypothetical protein